MTTTRYILLFLVLSIIGIGVFFYYKMGGFNTPEINVINAPTYGIMGKPYTGPMKGKAFGRLFEEADSIIRSKSVNGVTCALFENNPASSNDTVKAFIGVALYADTPSTLPKGYKIHTLNARKAVSATIKAHYMFVPQVYPKIKKYADKQGIKINDAPAFELYMNDNEVVIQLPVKE